MNHLKHKVSHLILEITIHVQLERIQTSIAGAVMATDNLVMAHLQILVVPIIIMLVKIDQQRRLI